MPGDVMALIAVMAFIHMYLVGKDALLRRPGKLLIRMTFETGEPPHRLIR